MPLFPDFLGGLDDHPDLNVPEGFGEGITSAYNADVEEATSSAQAMVADLTGKLDTALAEIQALKVKNYELIVAMPAPPSDGEPGADTNLPGPAETDAETADGGIAGLFESVSNDDDKDTK